MKSIFQLNMLLLLIIVDNDEILNIVNEIKMLITEGLYKIDSIKVLKKDYPDKIEKSEETLLNYIDENDVKYFKTEFPEKWNYLTKNLAYPYEFFNCIEDYRKPVDNLKNEDFFSKLKTVYPSDRKTERTKEIIELFNIKSGKELTEIYLKCDVLLLARVFEKFIKNQFTNLGLIHCIVLVYRAIHGNVV